MAEKAEEKKEENLEEEKQGTVAALLSWASSRVSLGLRLSYVCWKVAGACAFVLWSKFLYAFFPNVQRDVVQSRKEKRPQRMWSAMETEADWGYNFFATTDMIKERYNSFIQDPFREAQLNFPAPNPTVVSARSGMQQPLLASEKHGRPLVLNFGSCT